MAELVVWPAEVPEPLSAPPLTNAPSDGPEVIQWIEHNCVYGEGDFYGKPVKLELFEKLLLWWLFEKTTNGRYRYRRALIEMPKGNGKSLLMTVIALYLLVNRFSPVIPIGAASFDQAGLVFRDMQINV
ncbi:terminase large subunit domain-containing protein [Mycobacterium colombiense]